MIHPEPCSSVARARGALSRMSRPHGGSRIVRLKTPPRARVPYRRLSSTSTASDYAGPRRWHMELRVRAMVRRTRRRWTGVMTHSPITFLGGAGKTGRRIAAQLDTRGVEYHLASRSSERRFDWYDESTWRAAVRGSDTAYVAPPVDPAGCDAAARFVKQATADGLRRVVLLSGRGVRSEERRVGKECRAGRAGEEWREERGARGGEDGARGQS